MSFPSQQRVPYGMTTVPAGATVPGMAGVPGVPGVPGVAGMTAVPAGMARVPNGIGGLYQTEKPTSLYPAYHSLGQPGYLAQASPAAPGQTSFLGATQTGYLSASSPTSQQRYMVSPTYPGAGALGSGSVLTGAPGYSLATGGGAYALSTQPSSLSMTQTVPVATSSLSSQSQNPYPTYISSQLGPVQISPSQNPYAAAATGHPLYPASHLAGLQVQQTQVLQPGQQIPGRIGQAYSATTGLPLGYPGHATSPGSFYPSY